MTTVNVPPLTYLMVDGEGDPNKSKEFEQAVEALYSLSYTLKFSLKKSPHPVDYGVMPLEGLWWADDPHAFFFSMEKSAWKWTVMILQPEFISRSQVDAAFEEVRRKKNPTALDRVRCGDAGRGRGSTDALRRTFCRRRHRRSSVFTTLFTMRGSNCHGKHHEIYLNDPRRTAPEKLKTVLRQPMR